MYIYDIISETTNANRSLVRWLSAAQTASVGTKVFKNLENDLKKLTEKLNSQKPRTENFFKQIIVVYSSCMRDCLFLQVLIVMIINNYKGALK